MIDPNVCFGVGWVFENHPTRAWDKKGCQCGAGMPCECQRTDSLDHPDINKILETETDDVQVHRKN
jgi:hypothetical protein